MKFSKIKGQDRVIEQLQNSFYNDRLSQSYLFYGPEGTGKFTTALLFAMAINCTAEGDKPCGVCNSCQKMKRFSHPDFLYIFPSIKLDMTKEGVIKSDKVRKEYNEYIQHKIDKPWDNFYFSANTEIRIDVIRRLIARVQRSTFESKKKIIIVEHVEKLGTNAANAFLKTLEEPPEDSIIILTTSSLNSLLPTIISRCNKIPFNPVSTKVIEGILKEKALNDIHAKFIARVANGNVKTALQVAKNGKVEMRPETLEFLSLIIDNNEYDAIQFIRRYKSEHKVQLQHFFNNLIIWFCDIATFESCPNDIVNIDEPRILQKYIDNFRENNFVDVIMHFEDLKKRLRGHIYPQLLLTETFFYIKKRLKI